MEKIEAGVREEGGDALLLALKVEEGATKQAVQVVPRSWDRQRLDCAWSFQKEHSPVKPFETSDLQNCKRIKLCCFQPLCLW